MLNNKEVLEDVEMLVQEYALVSDSKLTKDAIKLKQDVIALINKLYKKINKPTE